MHRSSIILIAFVFLIDSTFSHVHNWHLRDAVDVSLLEPTPSKQQLLNPDHTTQEKGKAAPSGIATNPPFGSPSISINAGKNIKIVDGDIAQPSGQSRTILKQSQNWPHGIVPVEFDNSYSNDQKNIIISGMMQIMEATNNCIRFVWRDNNPYWIRIHPGSG
jgi:hypothetical protein